MEVNSVLKWAIIATTSSVSYKFTVTKDTAELWASIEWYSSIS